MSVTLKDAVSPGYLIDANPRDTSGPVPLGCHRGRCEGDLCVVTADPPQSTHGFISWLSQQSRVKPSPPVGNGEVWEPGSAGAPKVVWSGGIKRSFHTLNPNTSKFTSACSSLLWMLKRLAQDYQGLLSCSSFYLWIQPGVCRQGCF